MKKVIVIASLLLLASPHIISASEGNQLSKPTTEGQTISSQVASPPTDLSDTPLPAPSDHQVNVIAKPLGDLSKEGLSSASQSRGFMRLLNIFNLFKANKATQPLQPFITTSELASLKDPGTTSLPDVDRKDNNIESPQAVPDDISYQSLDMNLQGKDILTTFFTARDAADKQPISAQPNSIRGTTPADTALKNNQNPIVQTTAEDLPHKDLSSAIQEY